MKIVGTVPISITFYNLKVADCVVLWENTQWYVFKDVNIEKYYLFAHLLTVSIFTDHTMHKRSKNGHKLNFGCRQCTFLYQCYFMSTSKIAM